MSPSVTLNRHLAQSIRHTVAQARLKAPDACEQCSSEKELCAHHDDYAKPLEVRWLCRSCHIRLHIARGEWRTRLGYRATKPNQKFSVGLAKMLSDAPSKRARAA